MKPIIKAKNVNHILFSNILEYSVNNNIVGINIMTTVIPALKAACIIYLFLNQIDTKDC